LKKIQLQASKVHGSIFLLVWVYSFSTGEQDDKNLRPCALASLGYFRFIDRNVPRLADGMH
jgi:hypothetical protein